MMPVGMGVADFAPFAGYGLGAGESIEGVGQAKKEFEAGNYGSAALQYALSSLGLLPGAIGATAFHGTPNKVVDKFNLDKVGTGSGAQVYGHGIYFSESPETAKIYQTSGTQFVEKSTGKVFDTRDIPSNRMKDLKTDFEPYTGNLYKVDVPDADIKKMIDWDYSFNSQTPEVQNAFKKLYSDPKISDEYNQDWFKRVEKDKASMSAMYRNLATSDNLRGAKDVSRLLSEQGVTGIKYIDQSGHFKGGKRTSNFVTFNPEQVKILEENGINYDELMKSGLLRN
jgi:hypothetical protein